ncbi:MAG: DNA-processing protein DprA, partial [Bacteroidia bacterium]
MNLDELPYQIGLTLIEGIGDVNAKSLLAYCGSSKDVFSQKKTHLLKIPGIGEYLARSIVNSKNVLKRAEEEIKFIQKFKITPLFFSEENYPVRLKYCSDSPILLYYKGTADLNKEKIIGVVGTRKPSEHGKEKTKELISELKTSNAIILSGLAYGIDIWAH